VKSSPSLLTACFQDLLDEPLFDPLELMPAAVGSPRIASALPHSAHLFFFLVRQSEEMDGVDLSWDGTENPPQDDIEPFSARLQRLKVEDKTPS
jgi:hypothetical protein